MRRRCRVVRGSGDILRQLESRVSFAAAKARGRCRRRAPTTCEHWEGVWGPAECGRREGRVDGGATVDIRCESKRVEVGSEQEGDGRDASSALGPRADCVQGGSTYHGTPKSGGTPKYDSCFVFLVESRDGDYGPWL